MASGKLDGPRIPNYMAPTLIMIAVVGIVSVAITQGWLELDQDPVHLTVTAPEKVILPREGYVPLSYTVNLKNNTEETVFLEASNPCRVHRWFVADQGGNFVQGEPEEGCAQVIMNADLTAESFLEDVNGIELDSVRYQAGSQYQLMVRYWGYDRIHIFTVE